jgi:gamma-glutamyl hercynylcysteine S-oxide synthase
VLGQMKENDFGWDNEFIPHEVYVDEFHMSRYKVSNGEYLRFVQSGGTPSHFWVQRRGEWYLRRMFDEVPLPLNWPVYVTQQQAAAYAAWRGLSLPTEAQWQRAGYPDNRTYPWGEAAREWSYRCDPRPVDAQRESASPFGIEGLLGNGWEWTSSAFRPFEGFEPFPFYPGYSADFFDDDHFVLKGGAPCTSPDFLRRSFRNWFRSDYPYVYATFRCIHNMQ